MNLLLLSGESIRNKDWIYQVVQVMRPLFDSTFVHEYKHWASDQTNIDLEHELSSLRSEVENLDDYAVFAKSIGTVLTAKAITQGWLKPKKCLFTGAPLGYIQPNYPEYAKDLINSKIPALIIQNSHDPVGSYQELKAYFDTQAHPNIEIVETAGDTHSYDDLDDLNKRAQSFLLSGN